jgi:peptide/nickel transport system permease protein
MQLKYIVISPRNRDRGSRKQSEYGLPALYEVIIRKLPSLVATGIVVAVLTFVLIHLAPGDPLDAYLGQEGATAAERATIRTQLGLDKPVHVRLATYTARLVRGDLGSIPGKGPVSDIIVRRFAATARLALMAMAIASSLGILTGLLCGWYANSVFDRVVQAGLVVLVSAPVFWSGLLVLLAFSWFLNILPAAGSGGVSHLIMPALVLASRPAALVARVARANAVEVRSQTFVIAARARGLSLARVIFKHVLRVISIPVVTILGMDFASLLSGAVVTETVFSYQGIGQFAIEAISNRWYDAVMAVAMLCALLFVCANFLVDISYAWLDPRTREQAA